MEQEIRLLIAQYGVKGVYEGLHTILKQDYEALKAIFGPSASSAPSVSSAHSEQVEAPVKKEKKPVTVAKPKAEAKVNEEVDINEAEAKNDTIASLVQKTAKGAQILIQKMDSEPPTKSEAPPPSSTKPTFSTLKEAKQWQKAQEEAKHKALLHQGINPLSLLTKENLTQWIQEERKPYSVIARELVGLPEIQVASIAKEFGIKPVIGRPQKPKN